jgi:hypothetical protein
MYDVQLVNGDLPEVTTMISSYVLTIQRIQIRLKTFLGEWVLDTDVGIPYFSWRQQRSLSAQAVEGRIRLELEETPGVIRVTECTSTFNPTTRTMSTIARIVIEDEALGAIGATLGFEVGQDANSSPYFTIISLSSVGIVP